MMESVCLQEIKLCLLDHAAKHDMSEVVKYILKDKSTMEHLYKKFSNSSSHQEVQPTYLFLLLLEHLKESLQNFQPPDSSHGFSWDKEALSLIITILDVTYQQKPFVDFLTFMKLLKLLKVLVIFRMTYENVKSGHAICEELNLHFPHWSTDFREKLKGTYGDESEIYAEDIKETNSETRKFILILLVNPQRRKKYFETNFDEDVKKMVKKTMPLLDVVITAVKKLIGPSTVEQIISCTDENLSSSNDPAVQIILEYLKPDMTAYDFLELLTILEPSDCPEGNIRFGSPIEELNFLLDCGTLGDSGLKFSVVDDDTPPSSSDNLDAAPETGQKQYGPLGLFPPSAKKTAEELSEIQVAQEHMELVMDSEDEERL